MTGGNGRFAQRRARASSAARAAELALLFTVLTVVVRWLSRPASRQTGLFFLAMGAGLFAADLLLLAAAGRAGRGRRPAVRAGAFVLAAVLNAAAAFGLTVYYLQGTMLFYPSRSVEAFRTLHSESRFAHLSFTARDGTRLDGWLYAPSGAKNAPTVLYFGGNGQNSAQTLENFEKMGTFRYFTGYNVAMVDYRGYGYSGGAPGGAALFSDAVDVYDALVRTGWADPARTVPLGYSVGTGPAACLAAQRHTPGLILVAPYYDGASLCNSVLDIFHGPLRLLVRYPLDTEKYAPLVTARPLVFTSYADGMVSWRQSAALAARFRPAAAPVFVPGAGHGQYLENAGVLAKIGGYLAAVKEGKAG